MNKKIIDIVDELHIKKEIYNNFGRYNYRSAELILEKTKPILKKYGAILSLSDDIFEAGGFVFLKSTATLVIDDEKIECTGFGRIDATKKGMDGSQIVGSASSYARKYALQGLFLLDDGQDSDSTEIEKIEKIEKKVDNTINEVNKTEVKSLFLYFDEREKDLSLEDKAIIKNIRTGLASGKPLNDNIIKILKKIKEDIEIPF